MVSIGGSPISAALKTAMTQITGKSSGDNHQALLQALGMDQRGAALQGALHDLGQGNLAGYQKNLFEAFTGVDPGRIGARMCASHSVPSPSACMGSKLERMDLAKSSKAGLGAMLGGFALGGPLGALIGRNLSKRSKAKTLERRLNRDPIFRAAFEAKVGGRYVPDFRNDGKITIARPNFGLPGLNPGIFAGLGGNPIAGSALSGLAKMMGNAASMMQGLAAGGAAAGGAGGASNAYNSDYGSKSTFGSNAKEGSFMSKLPPNATFEDLVSAFMMDTVKEMQEEIKKEMDKMKQSNETNGGRGRRGYGGALGAVGGIAGGALGGMVGGPIGSQLGSKLGGAAGQALGGGGQQGGQAGDANGDSRQLMFENLKNMMNKLQQMMQSMSNVLNTMHQGAMNSIRNIRA